MIKYDWYVTNGMYINEKIMNMTICNDIYET